LPALYLIHCGNLIKRTTWVRDKDELISYSDTKYGQVGTLGDIFLTYVRNAWTYFDQDYQIYLSSDYHNTDDILKITGSKIKVRDNFSRGDSLVCHRRPSTVCLKKTSQTFVAVTLESIVGFS